MAPSPSPEAVHADQNPTRCQVLTAQIGLLYDSTDVGVAVTLIAASILARLQWDLVPHGIILGWCVYMFLVSAARLTLKRRFLQTARSGEEASRWGTAFAIGAGLAGTGWGAAGILLYPDANLVHQLFLVFTLGGMMLGAAFLLAPRPEAFIAFVLPTGLAPAARLLIQDGEAHLAMGLLAIVFTLATLIATARIHLTILSSLKLRFENHDLLNDLRAAKRRADELNAQLEVRVQERTAELRAEIAQREQIEEELLRARKLESLGVLAGGIAHDFNNFLTVVQGNIEMARMRLDSGDPVQEILDQTANACRRAAFLSSQLLTFAKGGTPVRRLISIADLVKDAVQLARAGTQTCIDVGIAEDLWFGEVDPGQISQVLHNILLNARQAMPECGIIEVRAENLALQSPRGDDLRVRISIRDYGCGIPASDLPRIFDPYFTTKSGAPGLGLATAYAIVTKHGGSISVKSQPGDGTTFIIDLPALKTGPAPQQPVVARIKTGTERLLVMDDEEALRSLLARVLNKLGYEVQTARDGAEAIALYERAIGSGQGFDAIMLDLTVSGGMGGIEAAARLKELAPAVKLIVSSGYSDSLVMSDFRRYGFDDVIPKPWTVAEVSEVFRRVLVADRDPKR